MSNTNSTRINDNDFSALLAGITLHSSEGRKATCLAFRAAMNDLYASKSVDRLNQLAAITKGLPFWPKLFQAVKLFAGGSVNELGANAVPKRIREDNRANDYVRNMKLDCTGIVI